MDTKGHGQRESKISLAALFQTQASIPLAETCGDDCHGFQIFDARNEWVREAAYLRAQARGFAPGHELEDWLAAEHEVDARIFAAMAPVGFVG
ncbi:MAG TPA: DUF2934 domain-containing protein [Steroidobacteraceae bacterium]|nr:DUF2934 domain-containing protein [Steroidobacteraceae bacterium]